MKIPALMLMTIAVLACLATTAQGAGFTASAVYRDGNLGAIAAPTLKPIYTAQNVANSFTGDYGVLEVNAGTLITGISGTCTVPSVIPNALWKYSEQMYDGTTLVQSITNATNYATSVLRPDSDVLVGDGLIGHTFDTPPYFDHINKVGTSEYVDFALSFGEEYRYGFQNLSATLVNDDIISVTVITHNYVNTGAPNFWNWIECYEVYDLNPETGVAWTYADVNGIQGEMGKSNILGFLLQAIYANGVRHEWMDQGSSEYLADVSLRVETSTDAFVGSGAFPAGTSVIGYQAHWQIANAFNLTVQSGHYYFVNMQFTAYDNVTGAVLAQYRLSVAVHEVPATTPTADWIGGIIWMTFFFTPVWILNFVLPRYGMVFGVILMSVVLTIAMPSFLWAAFMAILAAGTMAFTMRSD
jgi:hypothetical protein